jgi:amino acid transporter
MVISTISLFLTGLSVLFLSSSLAPGVHLLARSESPLSVGYVHILGISSRSVAWLTLIPIYATGFAFVYAYGKQMSSMARSGLLPPAFRLRTPRHNTPYFAVCFGSVISILAAILLFYTEPESAYDIFHVCAISSYCVYLFTFLSYILFKIRYSTMQRAFINPLGLIAPILGISIIILALIGLVALNNFDHTVIFFSVTLGLTIFYMVYGYKVQKFSEDEQRHMFKAYVINGKTAPLVIIHFFR